AKRNVGKVDAIKAPSSSRVEQVFEVQRLSEIDHIQHFLSVPLLDTKSDRRKIGCRVRKRPVAFAHNRWIGLAVKVDYGCVAFPLGRNPFFLQALHDATEHRVVMALAKNMIEGNMKAIINLIDLLQTNGHQNSPQLEILLVAGMELCRFF